MVAMQLSAWADILHGGFTGLKFTGIGFMRLKFKGSRGLSSRDKSSKVHGN